MTTRLTVALALVLSVTLGAVRFMTFEQLTVNTAVGFTSGKIAPNGATNDPQATLAACRLETAEIRWTIDGTTPTSSVGTLLEPGDWLTVTGFDSISRFRAIKTGATNGQLDCTYSAP